MFRRILFLTLLPLLFAGLSCEKDSVSIPSEQAQEQQDESQDEFTMPESIAVSVSGKTLQLKIEDNVATQALVKALGDSPISYEANDYGGFEKVGALGMTLPSNDAQMTTEPGDVVLYNSKQIVIFYGCNSWSYTRIGKLEYGTLDELKTFLKAGEGIIFVSLSLQSQNQ